MPRGAVENRLPIRSKPGRPDAAPAEGQLPIGGRRQWRLRKEQFARKQSGSHREKQTERKNGQGQIGFGSRFGRRQSYGGGCRLRLVDNYRSSRRPNLALQPLQVGAHLGRRLVTEFTILLQCVVDRFFQLGWELRIQPDGRSRRPVENGFRDHRRGLSAKRRNPGGHLVEHDAEREQVSPPIQILPF